MSLRIKLPGKATGVNSPTESVDSLPQKRKSKKRNLAIASDDEEEEEEEYDNDEMRFKQDTVHSPMTAEDNFVPSDSRFNDDDYNEPDPDTEFKPVQGASNAGPSNLSRTATKDKGRMLSDPPRKRARRAVELEEDYVENKQENDNISDEDVIVNDKKPAKRKGGDKRGQAAAGAKKKGKQDTTEKKRDTPQVDGSRGAKKRPRQKAALKDSDTLVDVVGDTNVASDPSVSGNIGSPSQLQADSPAPLPKKRKLPTIKKNKVAGSVGPDTPLSSASSKANPPLLPSKTGLPDTVKPPAGTRKPAATAGNADLDLSNASVYAELFNTNPGGGTPRAGSNRRLKDEERRKELDRMRDEARAKRSAEAKSTFDLQGQYEKIARFEEKLRSNHSSALFPNFLAGKWRELWEQERRKQQREREAQPNGKTGVK